MFQIRAWERYKFRIDYEHRQVFLLNTKFSIVVNDVGPADLLLPGATLER